MKGNQSKFLRERVAHEAAQLLYTSQEKEYKQAKQRASKILGIRILPTNFEVANQLDKIAGEMEGTERGGSLRAAVWRGRRWRFTASTNAPNSGLLSIPNSGWNCTPT